MVETVWLDKVLFGFITFLRGSNFPITLSEILSIYKGIKYIDIASKEQFYTLFLSILVKNSAQIDNFSSLFHIFFSNIDIEKIENREIIEKNSSLILDGIVSGYNFEKYEIGSAVKYIVLNKRSKIERLLDLSATELALKSLDKNIPIGAIFQKVKKRVGLDQIEPFLEEFENYLKNSGASKDDIERVLNGVKKGLKQFKKEIRKYLKNSLKKDQTDTNINKIEFSNYSDLEFEEIKKIVQKLSQKIKLKKAIKLKKSKKGVLDPKKIIKKSIGYNLIPFNLIYKKKRPKKGEIVILCDISESVRYVSKLMLQFIYSLQKFFKKVRSFLFIADSGEVTKYFENNPPFEAVEIALNHAPIDRGTNSNYLFSFQHFSNNFLEILKPETIFIVIGDGRGNYGASAVEPLIEITNRVKKTIWLNPDPKSTWGTGDSDMDQYERVVNFSYQVSNLYQLNRFVEDLLF